MAKRNINTGRKDKLGRPIYKSSDKQDRIADKNASILNPSDDFSMQSHVSSGDSQGMLDFGQEFDPPEPPPHTASDGNSGNSNNGGNMPVPSPFEEPEDPFFTITEKTNTTTVCDRINDAEKAETPPGEKPRKISAQGFNKILVDLDVRKRVRKYNPRGALTTDIISAPKDEYLEHGYYIAVHNHQSPYEPTYKIAPKMQSWIKKNRKKIMGKHYGEDVEIEPPPLD